MMKQRHQAHAMPAPPPRRFAARTGVLLSMLLAVLLTGCATAEKRGQPLADAAAACVTWYKQLDAATRDAGVRDGGAHRLAGFPFLRSDRFLAAMGDELANTPEAFQTWISRLAALDLEARAIELSNLPLQFVPALAALIAAARDTGEAGNTGNKDHSGVHAAASKTAIGRRTAECSAEAQRALVVATGSSKADRARLAALAQVPDDYSAVKRALGLYALTRMPFFKGVELWQQSTAKKFAVTASQTGDPAGPVMHYTPAGPPVAADLLTAINARRQPDALGMLRLSAEDEALLLRAYAPELEIETQGPYDRFGELRWVDGAAAAAVGSAPSPEVATGQPVMYQRLAYTRHHGQTLTQLVYSVWFPERPPAGGVDLLSGRLDSVVLRLTLAPDGTPWLYDSIHSCGCYHLFFTTPRAALRPAPTAGAIEWAFVPATLPAMPVGQRVVMRLASGTHYVEGLRPLAADTSTEAPAQRMQQALGAETTKTAMAAMAANERATAIPYTLLHDNALRALPVLDASAAAGPTQASAGGITRSAFWPSGIVPGTERGERLLFWPMGIESPGAMRQWGRQPTAFVGRRHFDDARLLEQRFDLLPK